METKVCGKCKIEKPVEQFAKRGQKWTSKCKQCHNEYYREYWKKSDSYIKHKERVKNYKKTNKIMLKAKEYGITETELQSLFDSLEDGKCQICNAREGTHIDHCHQTGKVRGILCGRCNTGIGMLGDNSAAVQKAAEYLRASEA